jgi:peptidoglycan/xylan/chitin deacetylase (PgdA/CDA1 family)/tetratricopeptide (TPR) repeat protein
MAANVFFRFLAALCNLLRFPSVQRASCRGGALAGALWLVGPTAFSAVPASAAPTSLEAAEAAVRQMLAGDLRGAAVTTREALDAEPGNTLLHNVAAALLLMTGDTAGAQSEWTISLDAMPDDGLALYSLGLLSLARGDRAKALDQLQLAERAGDRAACLLAERYLEYLNGAVGSGAGLALPDAYAASTRGLSGMAEARAGDHRRALDDLTAALGALPGDPYDEPPGLLMTFERGVPIRFGSPALPTGNGLAARRGGPAGKALSGTVMLAPEDTGSDAGYVVFKIDGALKSMANTRPFRYYWDTAQVFNGPHRVEIVVYDRQGQPMMRAERELRTANINAPVRSVPDARRAEQVRAALWQCLMLRPGRLALAAAAAASSRALGDTAGVERWQELVAALDPDHRDARLKQAGSAGPALWRGAPEDRVVALTFDDGPKPGVTEPLVNVLVKEGVPATFFVIGRHVTAYPDLARKIAEAGMEIEDHSYTHPNLSVLPPDAVERELVKTVVSVRAATGKDVRFFRPPGGNISPEVERAAAKWGLTLCMWTVDGEIMENGSPDRLIEYVVQKTPPGGIVLLHNGRMTTVEALPRIIEGLRRRGYSFVTIEQLAQRKAAISRQLSAVKPASSNR